MKVCSICKVNKEDIKYHLRKSGNVQSYCKDCASAKSLAYYNANKDKCKESINAYNKANRAELLVKAEAKRRAKGILTVQKAGEARKIYHTEKEISTANRLRSNNCQARKLGFIDYAQRQASINIWNKSTKLIKRANRLLNMVENYREPMTSEQKKENKAVSRKLYKQNNWEQYRQNKGKETTRRIKQQLAATPPWVDKCAINALKRECIRLNRQGIRIYEIDHIDPIMSTLVCGLHIRANLQILEQQDNRDKSNNFKPYSIDINGLRAEL